MATCKLVSGDLKLAVLRLRIRSVGDEHLGAAHRAENQNSLRTYAQGRLLQVLGQYVLTCLTKICRSDVLPLTPKKEHTCYRHYVTTASNFPQYHCSMVTLTPGSSFLGRLTKVGGPLPYGRTARGQQLGDVALIPCLP